VDTSNTDTRPHNQTMKYFLRSIPTVAYIPTSYIVWHFLSGIPRSTWRIKKVPQSIVAFIFAAMQEKRRKSEPWLLLGWHFNGAEKY
jgi:hypothetical protein